jgi:hypothetical protein
MRVVDEAARISDLTNGLPRVQQCAAMQQTRSMIQTPGGITILRNRTARYSARFIALGELHATSQ